MHTQYKVKQEWRSISCAIPVLSGNSHKWFIFKDAHTFHYPSIFNTVDIIVEPPRHLHVIKNFPATFIIGIIKALLLLSRQFFAPTGVNGQAAVAVQFPQFVHGRTFQFRNALQHIIRSLCRITDQAVGLPIVKFFVNRQRFIPYQDQIGRLIARHNFIVIMVRLYPSPFFMIAPVRDSNCVDINILPREAEVVCVALSLFLHGRQRRGRLEIEIDAVDNACHNRSRQNRRNNQKYFSPTPEAIPQFSHPYHLPLYAKAMTRLLAWSKLLKETCDSIGKHSLRRVKHTSEYRPNGYVHRWRCSAPAQLPRAS